MRPTTLIRPIGYLEVANYIIDETKKLGMPAVVNVSLGSRATGPQPTMSSAYRKIVDAGIPVAASAGNEGVSASDHYISALPFVVAVGSSTVKDERADFSNYGTAVDIYAPGDMVKILSIDNVNAAAEAGRAIRRHM